MTHLDAIPSPVQRAVALLRAADESVWLVGGATRDLLLGRPVKDFDLVIAGDGLRWARRIADDLGGAFVPLDAERGVGRAVVQHEGKPLWIDVARFRGKDDRGDGATLEEDLRLRDFTVNAIALDPLTGDTIDPTGGVADLDARQLRATGTRTFRDDPLRILRGVRLHATHGLAIAPETEAAMRRAVPGLDAVAAERIREEWIKLLAPDGASLRVAMLDELGVLARLLPELVACKGVTQSPPHAHDVFAHQQLALDAVESLWPWVEPPAMPFWTDHRARFREAMAAHLREPFAHDLPRWQLLKHVVLLHDVGKPATRTVGTDGRIHFYRHEQVGAEIIGRVMRRMAFSARAVQYAVNVVRHHLRPLHLSNHVPPRPRSIYRYYRDLGEAGPDVALHSIADQRGKAFATDRAEVVAVVERLLAAFFEERSRFLDPTPLLDGHDVMRLTGLKGPVIGRLLERLREQQAQGTLQTREAAEAAVRNWAKQERAG